jgi:hypothetical protein
MSDISIEKKLIKISIGSMIGVVIFVVSTATAFAVWKTKIENRVNAIEITAEACVQNITQLKTIDAQRDIQFAEIKKDLQYIILQIEEIKYVPNSR